MEEKVFKNYPVVDKYKYLGVWLNEKLNPEDHIEAYGPKINYLINQSIQNYPKEIYYP